MNMNIEPKDDAKNKALKSDKQRNIEEAEKVQSMWSIVWAQFLDHRVAVQPLAIGADLDGEPAGVASDVEQTPHAAVREIANCPRKDAVGIEVVEGIPAVANLWRLLVARSVWRL